MSIESRTVELEASTHASLVVRPGRHQESTPARAFWGAFSHAEIHEINGRLHVSIPAIEMRVSLGWMLPALSHAERVAMLTGMRRKTAAPVFEQVAALARERLDARDWSRLSRALHLSAPPELAG